MLKKAHVVNIAFTDQNNKNINKKSFQFAYQSSQYQKMNLQTYIHTQQCSVNICQLLNILRNSPTNISLLNKLNQNNQKSNLNPDQQYQNAINDQILYQKQYTRIDASQVTQILPKIDTSTLNKSSNKSIDIQISNTNSIDISNKTSTDQIKEASNFYYYDDKFPHTQTRFDNTGNSQNLVKNNQNIQQSNYQYFYLIPQKYKQSLTMILNYFLNFKLFITARDTHPSTANLLKRPKTYFKKSSSTNKLKQNNNSPKQNMNSPKISDMKPQTANPKMSTNYSNFFTSSSNSKPFTIRCQNKLQHTNSNNFMLNKPATSSNWGQQLNQNLENYIYLEKQLQKKSRRVKQLQNQLLGCHKQLKQKNHLIKQLKAKQFTVKNKFKYEVDKITKSKILCQINQVFLQNIQNKGQKHRNIFQINGKTYIKSQQVNNLQDPTFITCAKSGLLDKDYQFFNRNKLQNFQLQQADFIKKNQSIFNFSKYSNSKIKPYTNSKIQKIKFIKWQQNLKKQIEKLSKQKQVMLDKLVDNNGKLQKYIEKIQNAIGLRNCQIQRCVEHITRIKESEQ